MNLSLLHAVARVGAKTWKQPKAKHSQVRELTRVKQRRRFSAQKQTLQLLGETENRRPTHKRGA